MKDEPRKGRPVDTKPITISLSDAEGFTPPMMTTVLLTNSQLIYLVSLLETTIRESQPSTKTRALRALLRRITASGRIIFPTDKRWNA